MELETSRLRLRRPEARDRDAFRAMNSDPDVMRFFPRALTEAESDALLERTISSFGERGFGVYTLELKATGAFVGFTGLAVPRFSATFTPCVEIGWRLVRAHHRRGLAPEAAERVLAHAFGALGLEQIVSFTARINEPSIRVMEKLGMQSAGEFEHPSLPEGDRLRPHVLYRISRGELEERQRSRARATARRSGSPG
ncbi:MAG: GNAT family N-acetyltransferase [Deltaproteobacteria bacterium]|nr:GNAT family N-acetyltransferase [Deltaproteobacteria bacterium]